MVIVESRSFTDLTDDTFEDIVNKDVRGVLDPDSSARLRDPIIVDRWYNKLLVLKRSVEAQLAANGAERSERHRDFMAKGTVGKQEWFDYKAQADRWRASAVRFNSGVESKLAEARQLRSTTRGNAYVGLLEVERDDAVREVNKLRSAIRMHRDHICGSECNNDECVADDFLWSAVGE